MQYTAFHLRTRLLATVTTLAALLALPLSDVAAEAMPEGSLAEARILPGWRNADGSHTAALEITMPQGWHTYWRSPGDVGIPPVFDWSGSAGVQAVAVGWPVPQVFEDGDYRSLGYEDRLVLPLRVTLKGGAAAPRLVARASIGVCKDICVPADISAMAELPAPGQRNAAIAAALVDRPLTASEAGASARCRAAPLPDGLRIEAELTLPHTGGREHAAIESPNPMHWVSEPRIERAGNTLRLTADVLHADGRAVAVDRSRLRFTVLGRDRAVDIQGCSGF